MRRARILAPLARAPTLALLALALAILAPAARAQPLRLLLDGVWSPHHAPYFLAIERGLFERDGIEATLEPTRGASSVAVMVGNRAFDLGQMTASTAAGAIARGVPMRMIALYQPRTALAVVTIAGRLTLQAPADLAEHSIGATPGAADGLAMTIFRRANNLGTSTMTVMPIETRDKLAALVSGRVDAVIGDGITLSAALRATGHEPALLELASHGVPLQGIGLVASQAFIAQNADLLRRGLGVVRRAMAEAAAEPAEACRVALARVQMAETQPQCVDTLRAFLAHATPPDAPDWGRQSPEAWNRMIEALRAVGEIQGTRPASTYYTNDLLPPPIPPRSATR